MTFGSNTDLTHTFQQKISYQYLFNSTHSPLLLRSEFWEVISYQSHVSVCHLMTDLFSLLQKTAPSSNVSKWLYVKSSGVESSSWLIIWVAGLNPEIASLRTSSEFQRSKCIKNPHFSLLLISEKGSCLCVISVTCDNWENFSHRF